MIKKLKEIVRQAGELIRYAGGGADGADIKTKSGVADFVTEYDVRVQSYLMEKLGEWLPGCAFIGEESGFDSKSVEDGYTFIIDPIDGTTNFICGLQFSGISVALIEDGQPILGVVYNPFREEMFWAQRGRGAFLNETRLEIVDRPLSKGVANFGMTPYNPELRDGAFALAKAVTPYTMDLREFGSAALGICYAAANRVVVYYSPRLCVWDYAAAAFIVSEAGGLTLCGDGSPTELRPRIPVISGAPMAVREFLGIAAEN